MNKLLLDLLPDEPGSAHHALIRWLLALPEDADPAQAAQALLDRPSPPDDPPGLLALLRQVAQCRDGREAAVEVAQRRRAVRGFPGLATKATAREPSPCRLSPARRKA